MSDVGQKRIEWASLGMPVLGSIRERWRREKPLSGVRVGACLHVTTETANLMIALAEGGASVALCASNPLSTQDDVAGALNSVFGLPTFAKKGVSSEEYYDHINAVLDTRPMITMDDGADLVSTLHSSRRDLLGEVLAGTEETTTGVIRLRAMAEDRVLAYPIIAVNDAKTKHMFDNRYGTGQSAIDGILRATNLLIAGSTFVVIGYGWCGRGISMRARGMGARVVVVEVDPLKALEAVMDGYEVMPMREAARVGDVFVSVTGNINVIDVEHFELMKDGAILANAGHFNVEINVAGLKSVAESAKDVRPGVVEYRVNGKRIHLLEEGRLINLAAAEGHPAQVMDMSFANQALTIEWLVRKRPVLENKVYSVPEEIDHNVARLKLVSMGIRIDEMTREQREYLESWKLGT